MLKKISFIFVVFLCCLTVLTSCKDEKQYTITYNYNYGTEPATPIKVFKKDEVITLISPTRVGYDLEWWYLESSCDTRFVEGTKATKDLTLYANWTLQEQFTELTFDLAGAIGTVAPIKADAGSKVLLPECNATKEGYKFIGWTDGTVNYNAGDQYTMPDSDVSLSANWQKLTKVTFVDDNYDDSTLPSAQWYEVGQKIIFQSITSVKAGAKNFLGWNANSRIYRVGEVYTVTSTDITFTAVWADEIEISYDLAGGDIDGAETFSVKTGDTITLLDAPIKDGWIFTGWFDGKNTYAAGATYTVGTSSVIFIAEYKAAIKISYVYNYYENEMGIYEIVYADYQEKLEKPVDPTREDHIFMGWYRDAITQSAWNFESDKVRSEITLYAKWSHEKFIFSLTSDKTSWVLAGRVNKYQFGENLILPASYEGKPVIGIIDSSMATRGAFYMLATGSQTPVKYIYIPNTYEYIGDFAFYANFYVEQVEFEEGSVCTRFGKNAFYNFKMLEDINIPNTVTEIGEECFLYNEALKVVDLSGNVGLTELARFVFGRCYSLETLLLPSTIKTIGDAALNQCMSLKEFAIPEGVTNISRYFLSATVVADSITGFELDIAERSQWPNMTVYVPVVMALESITIPASVEIIGVAAFANCINLKNITFTGTPNVRILENFSFYNCDSLESFYVPDAVERVGISAFRDCDKLEIFKTTENSKLEYMYEYSLATCKALTDVELPTLKYTYFNAFCQNTALKVFHLPETLVNIADSLFAECTALESIHIPSSVVNVAYWPFSKCSSLTEITFDDDISWTFIPQWFFYECTGLITVNLPKSIQTISYGAFQKCHSLTAINADSASEYLKTVDGSLYSLDGKTLWAYAIGKTDTVLYVEDGCETIYQTAALESKYLKEVYIPASVKTIGSYAFRYITTLEKVVFAPGSQLQQLDAIAFGNNTKFFDDNTNNAVISANLTEVVITAVIPPKTQAGLLPLVYSVAGEGFTIYVPAESVEAYKADDVWKTYADYIKPIPEGYFDE